MSPQSEEGYLHIDGVRLEVRRFGDASSAAPELVFLHDGLGCIGTWRRFPDRLTDRVGAAGFAYSRAGYGRSDPITLPRSLDYEDVEAVAVLPRVLAAAGIGRPVLVGHSDGATISLIAVGSGAVDVAAIVAIAPHVFNEESSRRGIRAARAAFEEGDLRARLARYHGANVDVAFHGWSGVWLDPGFRDWSIEAVLPGIGVPLLVIQGEDDEYGTLDQVTAIARGAGGPVRTLVMPGCGHEPHRARPDVVVDAIASFLDEHGVLPVVRC